MILEDKILSVIWHELFHMASSIQYHQESFLGFMHPRDQNTGTFMGKGLTEGYTQLLTERYFLTHGAKTGAYEIEKFFAIQLEKIVGQKKMETFYSKAGSSYLISELSAYESLEHILDFLLV